MNGSSIRKATLGRLPQYLQFLKTLPSEREGTISATTIAKELSLGEVQVRKDLASVGGGGKPRVGYKIDELIRDIEGKLGREKATNAVLVGAGRLGRALLEYSEFEKFGVKIAAAFDRCEQEIAAGETKKILPVAELGIFCKKNDVEIGIITVGRNSAQRVCDKLIESGVKAIWNFAQCELKVPDGVIVKQENLALSLAYLNNLLRADRA